MYLKILMKSNDLQVYGSKPIFLITSNKQNRKTGNCTYYSKMLNAKLKLKRPTSKHPIQKKQNILMVIYPHFLQITCLNSNTIIAENVSYGQ